MAMNARAQLIHSGVFLLEYYMTFVVIKLINNVFALYFCIIVQIRTFFDRNEDRSPSSGNDGPRAAKRARQTSLSIVYDGNSRESTCPLFFQVELPGSDSEDEVYSVQVLKQVVITCGIFNSDLFLMMHKCVLLISNSNTFSHSYRVKLQMWSRVQQMTLIGLMMNTFPRKRDYPLKSDQYTAPIHRSMKSMTF